MAIVIIITIALLCILAAYFIGFASGMSKGFSNAFTMIERYEQRNGTRVFNNNSKVKDNE